MRFASKGNDLGKDIFGSTVNKKVMDRIVRKCTLNTEENSSKDSLDALPNNNLSKKYIK